MILYKTSDLSFEIDSRTIFSNLDFEISSNAIYETKWIMFTMMKI